MISFLLDLRDRPSGLQALMSNPTSYTNLENHHSKQRDLIVLEILQYLFEIIWLFKLLALRNNKLTLFKLEVQCEPQKLRI